MVVVTGLALMHVKLHHQCKYCGAGEGRYSINQGVKSCDIVVQVKVCSGTTSIQV